MLGVANSFDVGQYTWCELRRRGGEWYSYLALVVGIAYIALSDRVDDYIVAI
jgi:hypothetical protein